MNRSIRHLLIAVATVAAMWLGTAPALAEGGVVNDPPNDGVVVPGGTFEITQLQIRHKAKRIRFELADPGHGTWVTLKRRDGDVIRMHVSYDGYAFVDNGPCRGRGRAVESGSISEDSVAWSIPRRCAGNPVAIRARAWIDSYDGFADATAWSRWLTRG